ncbi:hypothetical protein DNTS_030461 [Danionella cerebrum]|uniref:Doublecortin domain-containing protein n=1 Tax=Danionella cerebrum TaxID=2873325 RepID=A0A553MLY3_9TELE|nr:hypothetical protein DNTS_030461 [Danionella translucida]
MQRTAPSPFDADAGFHNDTVQFPPPASSIGSSVTLAHPVKRITFFKSGDTQFKGVKMAIHKRSFKCFDALLDDLSQKVPLPFGVRTITTPKGTHNIKNLEQFEDGGCYLCSDHRSVKPINLEAAGKRSMVWHSQSHPNNTRRKPSRPDEPPSGHPHHHRQPKRIILVKNSDPSVRRSIVLSRRTARSLRVFIEEISELMQCHVKKLYTLEGHKIDSIQGLVQCPSVLVCVGREPFRPVLMENLRKLSDERLPGMSARSHSSIFSEGHESRKNVNFGLETKKSIIHPRSDSSNRSTRFSLSSDKSYQNGFCMTPRQSGCVSTCPYVKEIVVNDDIEKRVLVNKDGSLSVEMKVRFRLFNDETLQWSTEIKKSSSKENESTTVKDVEYLQAKAEHSDPDSICASDGDDAFAPKLHQKHNDETLCQNCCNHIQEYDIWKNPMHKNKGSCKSPSSTESSQKVVHKKSSMDSTRTISCSSGEYMEQVVEKASCFQQTMEEGDTRVEYCEVSRCCSRSEVSSAGNMSKNKKSSEDHCGSQVKNKCPHTDIIEPEISPMSQCDLIRVKEERPISAVSNSSKVLESLKEDQDDDYDDLPPSVSRASDWSQSDHVAKTPKENGKDDTDERSSVKSQLSSKLLINNQSDESRSGTAASVSLGLEEEQKCDDFEEQSTCCVKDGGDKLDTEERPKTNASMNSAVSGKSNKSHNSTSKTHVSTESGMSAELKKSKSGSQLNENNIRVPSALSLSSSHCKSPSRVSQRNTKHTAKKEGDCEAGNNNNPPEITVGSSNHQRASGKTTPASDRPESSKVSEQAATSKDGQSTKESDNRSKCSSKCLEINDGIQEIPNKIKSSAKGLDSSNESVLSRALSAADLLREIVSSDRPASRGSRSVSSSKNVDKVENKSQKSSKSKLSKSSECNRELIPSCLPNASPTEVVNDWLKNIPTDGYVYEIDAELNQDLTKIQGGEDSVFGDKGEVPESIIEVMEPHDTADNCDATHVWNERARLETSDSKALSNQDSLKNQCHSSVQVMKVLLGPKLDRSSSLPEVSHVYGRKLSQSAQGLLDCLANLRLIDSDPKDEKHQKYNEIMTILQSLWLQNPTDDDTKDNQGEDESNLRSSGVDETCVSNCCVKDTTNGDEQIVDNTQDTKTPSPEQDDEVNDGGNCTECLDAPRVLSKSVTPDIAQRVHESPEHEEQSEDQENDVVHEDVSSSENKNESDQTPQTTSYKSSGNESYTMKSPEDTSSGTPPSVQRAPLTKRVSQDPNPVWVLSLLKKLEKQFMLHYTDAMAEFKVKWDLDDNEMLNTMISELKEEVHKRIQSSINRELQKIQSRAGRGPRPPINALSRESTAQTEQRRKRLRVMRNKSILTRSDEDYTASGTENSDQRSEDEYCPCDACVKKKMASRAAQRAQALSTAPVMMEFDLRKILQMKKDPVKSPEPISEEPDLSCPVEKCENNLEVVHEEVDEVTEDTRGGTAEQEESGDAVNTNDEGDTKENEEEIEEEPTAEEDGEDKDSPGNDAANTQNGEMSAEIEAEETDAKEAQNETEYDNAEDGSESKSSKDDAHETTEEKKADRIPNEKLTSANQDGSEDGSSEKGNDEDQPQETCKSPDMVVRENSVGGHDETVENTIAKQATRTSVESQPGSEENNEIQTPQAKLKDLQSFMESVESQADSMVVITKQPPYKDPHEPGKQNGLIEWQVSPKIAIRGNKHNIQKSEQ